MAFCTKCGKELKEGEVCSCQQENVQAEKVEPVATEPTVEKPVEVKQESTFVSPAKKNMTPIIIGGVAVLLILVLIFALGGKGYKKPLDQYVDLMNKKMADTRECNYVLMGKKKVKLQQKLEKAMLKSEDHADSVEESLEMQEERFEECSDELGKWKLSYELKNVKKLEEKDIKKYQKNIESYYEDIVENQIEQVEDTLDDEDELEEMADSMDISEKEAEAIAKAKLKLYSALEDTEVSAGYELKVKFYLKSSEEEYKTETVKVLMLKVNGDWVYAGPINGRFSFDENLVNFMVNNLNNSYLYY